MATTLDTGYWSYASRWKYPDEHVDAGIIPEHELEQESEDLVDEKQQSIDATQEYDGNSQTQTRPKSLLLSSPSGSPKASMNRNGASPSASPYGGSRSPSVSSPTGGKNRQFYNASPNSRSRPESPSFLPPIPSRLNLLQDSESAYTEHFSSTYMQGAPEKNPIPGGLRNTLRRRGRGKAPSSFLNHHLDPRYYESQIERETASSSETASRLWGRINPSFCVVPYMTSSQRDFQNWQQSKEYPIDEINPMESRFNLKVNRKDFKEELAKMKRRLVASE